MLGGKNKIPFKVDSTRYKISQIKTVYERHNDENLKVWTKSRWKKAKVIRKEIDLLYEVTYKGDPTIYYFNRNHLHKILGEEKLQDTYLLLTGDLIPFARKTFKDTSLFSYRDIEDVKESNSTDNYAYEIEVKSSMYMLENGLYVWNANYYREDF